MILDCIIWPSAVTVFFEHYKGKDADEFEVTDVCRVTGYLKTFIENGMYGTTVVVVVIFLNYCINFLKFLSRFCIA